MRRGEVRLGVPPHPIGNASRRFGATSTHVTVPDFVAVHIQAL
jgi:hypothetical protein